MKSLEGCLSGIEYEWNGSGSLSVPIARIVCHSRDVKPGDFFVAISGPNADGHKFLEQAASNGACALLLQTKNPFLVLARAIPQFRVQDTRLAFGEMLKNFFGRSVDRLQLIGVTGTNGKTTTAYLVSYLLNRVTSCGLIGTVQYAWANQCRQASNTTPGIETLIPLFDEMVRGGVSHCAAEVSSHALDQNRIAGLHFATAVFTNLTQDHLDYHHDMETYFLAKRKLFMGPNRPERAIVNGDDPYGKRLALEIGEKGITYGFQKDAMYRASHPSVSISGCEFDLAARGNVRHVKTRLPLHHNIYNVLAALAVVSELGFSLDDAIARLEHFPGVPGRMEAVNEGQDFGVFVDYAHTPDALQNVFLSVKPLVRGRLISVFGCGGDRDRGKRPLMGEIAGRFSDSLFLTNDNPRGEVPSAILDEIEAGIPDSAPAEICRQEDRREAIRLAIHEARPSDVVLILGKGHESGQAIGRNVFPFHDVSVVRECLREFLNVKAGGEPRV